MQRAAVIACCVVSASALLVPRHATKSSASALLVSRHATKPLSAATPAAAGVKPSAISGAAPALALATLLTSEPANAANVVLPSAFAAYGHYLGLFVAGMALAVERATIKPGMSDDEESVLGNADIAYGVAGLVVVVTGYLRATADWGKGWEFYAHSPVFWVKLALTAVAGASSLFPTYHIVRRAVAKANGEGVAPMSEKLAARMTTLINAELLAILSIPLAATLMARGVGYVDGLPWAAGAAPVVLAFGGFGFKYVKEALEWEEEASEAPTA